MMISHLLILVRAELHSRRRRQEPERQRSERQPDEAGFCQTHTSRKTGRCIDFTLADEVNCGTESTNESTCSKFSSNPWIYRILDTSFSAHLGKVIQLHLRFVPRETRKERLPVILHSFPFSPSTFADLTFPLPPLLSPSFARRSCSAFMSLKK